MFPAFGTTGGTRASLVEFNAGKMTTAPKETGSTKLVITPDLQKGKIVLVRGDDQLLHFQWKNRTTGAVVDDFIIFPNDASFQKVDTGRPNDRVYVLQYKGSSRRFFFWMQNKDGSKDVEQAKKVDDLMNSTAPAASSSSRRGNDASPLDPNAIMQMLGALGGGSDDGHGSSAVQMAELQQILQHMGMPASSSTGASANPSTASAVSSPAPSAVPNSPQEDDEDDEDEDVNMEEMSEEELLRLAIEESMRDVQDDSQQHEPEVPATPAPPTATPSIQLADFQRAMAAALNVQQSTPRTPISITALLQQPAVQTVLQDPSVQAELLPMLPESLQTQEELAGTTRTPQLRQCVGALSHALNSSNFNGILSNFGLDASAGHAELMRGDGIGAFLAAVVAWGKAHPRHE
ncbi:proteasomal ubiquitin receptor ADRM1 [Thraustotheca clavata]|uniref:Proteasomal ubiquitin receptor ADRM1 n=1 Tax=Thraustotheca clavata TaxID=74557 RepID=A0A1W0A3R9_9STRA|nr:proteasomal ubiquitin receptor ADRM1 [Thraustotheca clavata]